MSETWAMCPHCHDVRSDVRRRDERVEIIRCCDDCARLFPRTRAGAESREYHAAPQEGGRDVLANFEGGLARYFERRARQRRHGVLKP